MAYKIMLLLKQHIIQYCRETLKDNYNGAEIIYRDYKDLNELISIFIKEKTLYDGFITSGYVPLRTIKRFIEDHEEIPVAGFEIEVEHVYQMLLKHMLQNEQMDVNRIGIDFLEDGTSLRDALIRERLPAMAKNFCKTFAECPPEELEDREAAMYKAYEEKLKRNKLDLIITQFHTVCRLGESYGVDSYYVIPA